MAENILRQALRPDLIKVHLEANTKPAAIAELVGILDGAGLLSDPAEVLRVVMAREATMSTGMESGLAIPHGKTDTVDRLLVAMALKPEGLDFDCQDGQPARILMVTVSPASRSGPHLRFMADITRLLRDESLRQALLASETSSDILARLVGK